MDLGTGLNSLDLVRQRPSEWGAFAIWGKSHLMARIKRSQFLLVTLEDLEAREGPQPSSSELVITAIVAGEHLLTDADELEALANISCSTWTELEDLQKAGWRPERIGTLLDLGVLLLEGDSPRKQFADRENKLEAGQWPPCAAAFHMLNFFEESRKSAFGGIIDTVTRENESDRRAEAFIESYGLPPDTFYCHPKAGEVRDLPLEIPDSQVAETLLRRRTERYFEPGYFLSAAELSSLLRLTFAPVATRWLAGKVQLQSKTSPSGGSLHPMEAYPILLACEGWASGAYHYRADRHGLELIRATSETEARRVVVELAQGQDFVGTCSMIVLLVGRFDRNFWKYRRRENSYSVVLQDAGHLGQTFQILATEQGLGSFYTAALNPEAIVALLGLEYPDLAPISLVGVGRPSSLPGKEGLHPYDPGTQRR